MPIRSSLWATGIAAGSCLLLAAVPVAAQDVTAAAAVFDRGVADMEQGRFATACPEIAESLRIDPRPGTLFTLAECYSKAGKTASAVARYEEYLDQFSKMTPDQQAKQQDRPQVAQSQAAFYKPRLPMLTLQIQPGSPAGTVVVRDGETLGAPSLSVALPVDPGSHTVTTQPPGGAVSTQTFNIAPGERKVVVLSVSQAALAPVATTPGTNPATTTTTGSGDAQRIAGYTVGGVGVAGILIGAITGGITLSRKSKVSDECNLTTKHCVSDAAVSDAKSAQTTGIVSTVGFVAGGILLAGGVVIVLTAPRSAAAPRSGAPSVGVGLSASPYDSHLTLSGSF